MSSWLLHLACALGTYHCAWRKMKAVLECTRSEKRCAIKSFFLYWQRRGNDCNTAKKRERELEYMVFRMSWLATMVASCISIRSFMTWGCERKELTTPYGCSEPYVLLSRGKMTRKAIHLEFSSSIESLFQPLKTKYFSTKRRRPQKITEEYILRSS